MPTTENTTAPTAAVVTTGERTFDLVAARTFALDNSGGNVVEKGDPIPGVTRSRARDFILNHLVEEPVDENGASLRELILNTALPVVYTSSIPEGQRSENQLAAEKSLSELQAQAQAAFDRAALAKGDPEARQNALRDLADITVAAAEAELRVRDAEAIGDADVTGAERAGEDPRAEGAPENIVRDDTIAEGASEPVVDTRTPQQKAADTRAANRAAAAAAAQDAGDGSAAEEGSASGTAES